MNKKDLSERDICTRFITPSLTAGNKWDLMSQIREEAYFTKGRVIVRGQLTTRGDPKRADYLLSYKPGTVDDAHRDPPNCSPNTSKPRLPSPRCARSCGRN